MNPLAVLSFFSNVKKALTGTFGKIVLGAVIGIGLFYAGYHFGTQSDALTQAKHDTAVVVKQNDKLTADKPKAEKRVEKHTATETKTQIVTKTIIQKVPVYVQKNPSCDLDPSVARMLNDALRNDLPRD